MADISFKLRMKVGVHEFDAEGPKEEVNARFEKWQAMVEAHMASTPLTLPAIASTARLYPPTVSVSPSASPSPSPAPPEFAVPVMVQRVFAQDDRRGLITLRVHPMGDNIDADAVLLLLYGYREIQGADEVPVTKLTQSMRLSGLRADRIDRAAAPHRRTNFLIKHGSGKGGHYALTTTGRDRAEVLTTELYERVA